MAGSDDRIRYELDGERPPGCFISMDETGQLWWVPPPSSGDRACWRAKHRLLGYTEFRLAWDGVVTMRSLEVGGDDLSSMVRYRRDPAWSPFDVIIRSGGDLADPIREVLFEEPALTPRGYASYCQYIADSRRRAFASQEDQEARLAAESPAEASNTSQDVQSEPADKPFERDMKDTRRSIVRDLAEQGHSPAEIGHLLGINETRVRKLLQDEPPRSSKQGQ